MSTRKKPKEPQVNVVVGKHFTRADLDGQTVAVMWGPGVDGSVYVRAAGRDAERFDDKSAATAALLAPTGVTVPVGAEEVPTP